MPIVVSANGFSPRLKHGLLEGRIGPRVRLLRNALTARVVTSFASFDLPSGAFTMLALIGANPGCSQTELARESGLDKSVIVALIDELESKELVTRTRSKEDRRRYILTLTTQGEQMMAGMHAASHRIEKPIVEALSPDEIRTLTELLDRAYDALLGDWRFSRRSQARGIRGPSQAVKKTKPQSRPAD
jgi:DNA-binding MarR family transcriptional regulator